MPLETREKFEALKPGETMRVRLLEASATFGDERSRRLAATLPASSASTRPPTKSRLRATT